MEATSFQRSGLAEAAVQAHEAVLAEFDVGGSAQLLREGKWFCLDEDAVARSTETVAIVAVLIATMGFTGFLSPPGGWTTTAGSSMALAVTSGGTTSGAFTVFAVSNALALAVSLSLVLMLAVASLFGLKVQSMRWVLYSSFELLTFAVVSGFVAFGAAAFIVSADNSWIPYVVIAILCGCVLLAAVWLVLLVMLVQRKARRDAYQQRLGTLCQMLEHTLHVLRRLNNNYVLPGMIIVGDPILGRYYHCYTVVMLATLVPLFHHLIERASHSAAHKHVAGLEHLLRGVKVSSHTATQGLSPVDGVLRYLSVWCGGACRLEKDREFSHHFDDVDWNVGVLGLEYEPYYGGSDHLPIRSGTLHNGSQADELIKIIDGQARKLVDQLLLGHAQPPSLGAYRELVKYMFMAASLSHMMPSSIRTARLS